MELNEREKHCLVWLLLHGGRASYTDWETMREEQGIRPEGTNLRNKKMVVFYDSTETISITSDGVKAVEGMK